MSLKLGTTDIAGISQNTKYNAHHLLDFKWTDCIMNDVSWLRADTFSWQSGDVYTSAYNHLVADLQGTTAETETIGSYTVTFYRATDGHKICLADQEQTVLNIYNTYGIAWYYILDTTNTQFKLPRTKFGFEGLRTNVGDNINESLPNITGTGGSRVSNDVTGAFYVGTYTNMTGGGWTTDNSSLCFDASLSSSTYQNNAPVQERATQMYLYFYVGDYTQSAIEQTAGLNSELFNSKADTNLANTANKLSDVFLEKLMPDYDNGIAISLPFTAPAIGYVFLEYNASGSSAVSLNGTFVAGVGAYSGHLLPVYKNDIVDTDSGDRSRFNASGRPSTFYPCKGVD